MENTEFENLKYYRMMSNRLNQLIADVTDLEFFYKSKKESKKSDYINFLQCEIPNIETTLNKTLTHLKITHIKDDAMQRFFRYSKRLNYLLFEFENELKRLNTSRNIEFENAFDFDLDNNFTLDRNQLLPNYLDIEKEFRDFIKIEAPQQNNNSLTVYDYKELTNNSETLNDFNFKNNFNNVEENTIIEYFTTSLVHKNYLSETVLNEFLDLAFDKKTLPKHKFSFEKLNTQKAIVKIFYNFYISTAGKPYGKQKEYLNLLCNYFNGFENFNIKNFSK